MRVGGLGWFITGFALCLVYLNDGIGGVLTFVLTLGGLSGGGAVGAVAVLALIGVALLIGRSWAERARGSFDADEAFNRRKNYRKYLTERATANYL